MKYCVYLTVYRGKWLPPFYIGHTEMIKVIMNNYNGSVSSEEHKFVWDFERKRNQQLFETYIISLHDTKEEAYKKEIKLQKRLDVVNNPLYVNKNIGGTAFGKDHHKKMNAKLLSKNRHVFQGSNNNKSLLSSGKHSSQKEWKCPVCGFSGRGTVNAKRFHFDNCKTNNQVKRRQSKFFNGSIVTFTNNTEIFIGTPVDFSKKYMLSKQIVSKLVNGRISKMCGWSVKNES